MTRQTFRIQASRHAVFNSALLALAVTGATPLAALAAPATASCSVEINYSINGALAEPYTNSFVIARGEVFVDDFSTATREKRFTASMDRVDGKLMVMINYFNDVGTFTAIDLDTSLRVRGVGALETTAGSHTFSSSQAVPAGNHTTDYTLVCFRNDPEA